MKSVDSLLPDSLPAFSQSVSESGYKVHENKSNYDSGSEHDVVDAINQMFAEFELAYHNQFHKAYSADGSVGLAKKYWFSSLNRFTPQVILKATRQVTTTNPYLPSLSNVVEACENSMTLFGLPSAYEAYRQACCAPEPKAAFKWSHPAVYFAGKACDWFELASQTEKKMFPLFEHHYRQLCDRVLSGQSLELPIVEALAENHSVELEPEEQQARLEKLRAQLKL